MWRVCTRKSGGGDGGDQQGTGVLNFAPPGWNAAGKYLFGTGFG